MKAPYQIELLGGLRVVREEGEARRLRSQKMATLLAYLALHPRHPHSRELLFELLWPECDPEIGRRRLRNEIALLRRFLEVPGVEAGAILRADDSGVQLNPDAVTTDVALFDARLLAAEQSQGEIERAHWLAEAVMLYAGELLPGFFDEWALAERGRLAEAHLQALAQLARCREQAGDLPGAIEWARRSVRADPLGEESHHELIRLLAAAGQQNAALRQYRVMERRLQQELGIAPAPEVRALVAARTHPPPRAMRRRRRPSAAPEPDQRDPLARTAGPSGDSTGAAARFPMAPMGTVTLLLAELSVQEPEDAAHWFRRRGGHPLRPAGICWVVAFPSVRDAALAALALPDAWPAGEGERGRIVLHTGEGRPQDGYEVVPALPHAERLLVAAPPGRLLVSATTAALLQAEPLAGNCLVDLGRYRLRDGSPAERLFLLHQGSTPPRSLPRPNAAPAHEGYLPLSFTRFVGREAEVAALVDLLSPGVVPPANFPRPSGAERFTAPVLAGGTTPGDMAPRIVTLTGAGGSGKTRLALEVARQLREPFRHAVWFVPLQDVTDARRIPEVILAGLRAPRLPDLEPLEQIRVFLAGEPSLLVLDNFEHLVENGAVEALRLLDRIAPLTLLVTSRRRLELPGEQVFPVGPLPVPDSGSLPHPSVAPRVRQRAEPTSTPLHAHLAQLAQNPSVALFVDRAQAVRSDFQLTVRNAPAVVELCARLEGLPLALVLAAARAGVLTPTQMVERLSTRLDLLIGRAPGTDPRHRSLRAALEWSYQLLPPAVQRFFACLSVFRGGWSLAAAEGVSEEPQAIEYLEELRRASLVQADESAEELRFSLLETVREYATEKLEPEERCLLQRRHAVHYLALAEEGVRRIQSAQRDEWVQRLEIEHENLRAALAWSEGDAQGVETQIRLAGALGSFWFLEGHWREGCGWLERALARPGAERFPRARGWALMVLGLIASEQGDRDLASLSIRQSADLLRKADDPWSLAWSLCIVLFHEHDAAAGEEGLRLFTELDDTWGQIFTFYYLGNAATRRQQLPEAHGFYSQSLAISRTLGHAWAIARPLSGLANVAWQQGDMVTARSYYEESIAIRRSLGDWRPLGWFLDAFAEVALRQDDLPTARSACDEALAFFRELDQAAGIAQSLRILGQIAFADGDPHRGLSLLVDAVTLYRTPPRGQPDHGLHFAACLDGVTELFFALAREEEAARLFGAAEGVREALGSALSPADRERFSDLLRRTAAEPALAAARIAGRLMTPDAACAFAINVAGALLGPTTEPK